MPTTTHDDFQYKALDGTLSVDEAKGVVECFVAAIGNKDSVGDIIIPGAFTESLKRRTPRVVWGHDWNHPIGKVLEMYEVGPSDPRLPAKMKQARVGGLYARVQFNLKSEKGREAFSNIVFFGGDQEWSIGYKTLDAVYDNNLKANVLKSLELYECSPVLHGANQLTATISIKSDPANQRVDSFRKSKWDMFDRNFAEMVKKEHPRIWNAGGNIKGDDQYEILTRIAEQGGVAKTEDQIKALELREAWVARHEGDFRLPGVVAQMKWLAIGSRGEDHMKSVVREAIKKQSTKGEAYDEDEDEDEDETPTTTTAIDTDRLAAAIEAEHGGKVRIREVSKNSVVFDRMVNGDMSTLRSSYHVEDGQVMVGDPERVKPTTVFLPVEDEDDAPQGQPDDTTVKAPQDVALDLPQEAFTGDVLRGYGPRRGNLERLLRYWRPIMKKPGGFRRCRVILADHPDLYPLERICAWLHHETTGLWPNEGCHHPGMKNCRRKLRGVVNGSVWSDREFGDRLENLTKPGKSAMGDLNGDGVVTDDDLAYANKVLREFMEAEKEFMQYLADDKNWEHVGDDEDGEEKPHPMMMGEAAMGMPMNKPGGCGCGCGDKSADDDLDVKVGRALSGANVAKLQQAMNLIGEVVAGAGASMNIKAQVLVAAEVEDLFDLKSFIDPVLDAYGIEVEVTEAGIAVQSDLSSDAEKALTTAVGHYADSSHRTIQIKSVVQAH